MPCRYKHSWCFPVHMTRELLTDCGSVVCSVLLAVFSQSGTQGEGVALSRHVCGMACCMVSRGGERDNRIAWDEELNPTSVFKAAAQTRWPSHSIGRRESLGKGHSYRTHGKKGSEWLWTAPQRADYVIRIFLFWTSVLLIICWVCSGMVLNLRSQFQYLEKKKQSNNTSLNGI